MNEWYASRSVIVQRLLHFVSAILSGVLGRGKGKGREGSWVLNLSSPSSFHVALFVSLFFLSPPPLSHLISQRITKWVPFFLLGGGEGVFGWTTFCCPIPQKKKEKSKTHGPTKHNRSKYLVFGAFQSVYLLLQSVLPLHSPSPSFFIMFLW